MTKQEARKRFSDAHDGEMDPATKQEFDRLLQQDADLAAEYERFRKLFGEELSKAAATSASPDVLGAVQSKIRTRSRGRFYRDRFAEKTGAGRAGFPLLLLVSTGVVLGLAWLVWLVYGVVAVD